jgi:hypothetical protein
VEIVYPPFTALSLALEGVCTGFLGVVLGAVGLGADALGAGLAAGAGFFSAGFTLRELA